MILRPYKDVDAKTICSWIKDEKGFYQWSAATMGEYPLTPQKLIEHYNTKKDDTDYFVFCACDDNGQVVGQLIMRYPSADRQLIRFGYIIVNSEIRGKGYGKQMLSLAKEYAFKMLGAKRVTLGVFENNPAAIYCYRAVGLKESGEVNTYNINGEEWKCIEMVAQADAL